MPVAPSPDASPIDYAGLDSEEESAQDQLRKDLDQVFRKLSLSREDWAHPAAHVELFPAFTTYAQTLIDVHSKKLASTTDGDIPYWHGVRKLQRALLNHIAPDRVSTA